MVRNFLSGLGMLLRGFGIVLRSPRLLLLGALPALITGSLLVAAVIALAVWAPDLIAWATPFADSWDSTARELLRTGLGISAVVATAAVGLLVFAAVTLAIGAPFYERIAEHVERKLGGVPEQDVTTWWQDTADNAKVVGTGVLVDAVFMLADFIPVVGSTVVPVVAACTNAWLFGLELTVVPFTRRGLPLAARRALLGRNRAMALGFALPCYLLCLVPLVAIVVMPAATAGGALLAHRMLETEAARAAQPQS